MSEIKRKRKKQLKVSLYTGYLRTLIKIMHKVIKIYAVIYIFLMVVFKSALRRLVFYNQTELMKNIELINSLLGSPLVCSKHMHTS